MAESGQDHKEGKDVEWEVSFEVRELWPS